MDKNVGGTMKTAKNVTASLHRTRVTLEKALHGSEMATQRLYREGELITDTEHEHAYELKGALRSTKTRLNAVKTSELWEKYSVSGSLVFFFSVVIYIVAKRTRMLYLLWIVISSFLSGEKPADPSHARIRSVERSFDIVVPEDSCRNMPAGIPLADSQDGSFVQEGVTDVTNEARGFDGRSVAEGREQGGENIEDVVTDNESAEGIVSKTGKSDEESAGATYREDTVSLPDKNNAAETEKAMATRDNSTSAEEDRFIRGENVVIADQEVIVEQAVDAADSHLLLGGSSENSEERSQEEQVQPDDRPV